MKNKVLIFAGLIILVTAFGCKSYMPANQAYTEENAQNIADLTTLVKQQNAALVAVLPEVQGFDYNLSIVERNTQEQLGRSGGLQMPPLVKGIGSVAFKGLDAQTGGLLGGVLTAVVGGVTMYGRHKRRQWLETPTKKEENNKITPK